MIAHVSATFPPYWAGTGNVVYHNARLLHERGHRVTVFTARTPGAGELELPFRVERLPALFRLGNAPCTPDLVRRLRGFRLIHLHYPYIFGAEFALLAASLYRVPLVLTYHNRLLDPTPLKRALFGLYNRTAEPLLLLRTAKLLAVRREHFASLHPRARVRVAELANGVDTRAFAPGDRALARAELGLPDGVPVALFVGALDQAHRFKNVEGLLAAFARLPLPDARLLVVGDGDLRPALATQARALGLADRVRFLGARAPQALPTLYRAADVTVLPSTGVESFGLVLLESLACATPVIASDLPGVRTLVATGDVQEDGRASGEDGLRVPPGDVAALRGALYALLSDPARAARMGRAGREKVVAEFDWRAVGDRLEGLYGEVLGA